jgi:tRNA (guanine-N7-)-methyltransferase
MGRRSLPRIDTTLDLSKHHYALAELPETFSPQALFTNPALPLEVEIGSGKGLFLESASRANAAHNFLGIEIARKYARFAASKLARAQRENAVMLQGDARVLMVQFLADRSCAAVHVYFPDPWWKKRHLRRRIMNPTFVREIQRVLTADGTLHFWTDVEDYFHAALATLAEHTSLVGPLPVPELPPEHDLDYRTHFERRMRLHQIQVWRAEFRQSETPPPSPPATASDPNDDPE